MSSLLDVNVRDYKAGVGQGGVTPRTSRMFVWLKHETGLISSTTVFEKRQKKRRRKKERKKEKKPREREKSSKMRGEKSDPLTVRRGTGNYKSTFMCHGVILQRLENYMVSEREKFESFHENIARISQNKRNIVELIRGIDIFLLHCTYKVNRVT